MSAVVAVPQFEFRALAPASHETHTEAKWIVVAYGFWIFLLSDIVMFSALFAAYAVLGHASAGGPTAPQLFSQVTVAIETACLLASSYTCGLMWLGLNAQHRGRTYAFAAVTFVLGAAFLGLELREFAGMIARGATPQRSAFLSAFFTLVGCHGLHVAAGLLWLVVMMAQVAVKGFHATVKRRLQCFALFWHALDIIWVGLFTVVYLIGGAA
jgi:cytochrome o ubiquinol oxidase subunit 3